MRSKRLLPLLAILACAAAWPAFSQVDLDAIGTECVDSPLRDCRVLSGGFINSAQGSDEGAPSLAWQTQSGITPEAGVLGGFVLFTYEEGAWQVLDAGFDGYGFGPPRVSEAGLLHIAGYTGGTGAYNADRLYQWGDLDHAVYREGWRPIDMDSWFDAVGDLLPEGLEIWKGVQYSIANPWSAGMVARTELWRADDANCCPTGGSALITFEIADGRLVIVDLDYMPPDKREE